MTVPLYRRLLGQRFDELPVLVLERYLLDEVLLEVLGDAVDGAVERPIEDDVGRLTLEARVVLDRSVVGHEVVDPQPFAPRGPLAPRFPAGVR